MNNNLTLNQIAADVIMAQDACNMSGLVKSWAQWFDVIWAEARAQGKGTDWVNSHPINVLMADKVKSLTNSAGYFEAYDACKELANEKGQE